jgi:hypothetical protein
MKRCPQGHIYPDPLLACPVCDQSDDLQTIIRESEPKDKKAQKQRPEFSNPNHYSIHQQAYYQSDNTNADLVTNQSDMDTNDYDDDKTIVIRISCERQTEYLTGWLVELNFNDQPIKSYQLLNTKMSIGRKQDNDIIIESGTISRHHCHIEYLNGKLVLSDNDSANKTKVNDKPVESCQLKESHIISMGKKRFRIKYL